MQAIEPLADGGALKLTVARFLLAGARAVDGRGIIPDLAVPAGARRPTAFLRAAVRALARA